MMQIVSLKFVHIYEEINIWQFQDIIKPSKGADPWGVFHKLKDFAAVVVIQIPGREANV